MDRREENPFEDKIVAAEWINSIENERGLIRDNELYPRLRQWIRLISPKVLVDIGSGQGIVASKVIPDGTEYYGIEPSGTLRSRALQVYKRPNLNFIAGTAYEIPLSSGIADACLSVNVWFHLANLKKASNELARVLKQGGHFLISTGNPNAYKEWETFYFDYKKNEKMIDGKVNIPVNPLSRNILYLHTLGGILSSLETSGLSVLDTSEFGYFGNLTKPLFIDITGEKVS